MRKLFSKHSLLWLFVFAGFLLVQGCEAENADDEGAELEQGNEGSSSDNGAADSVEESCSPTQVSGTLRAGTNVLSLDGGEKRKLSFSPQVPKTAGPKRYRILITPPRGDSDPSNNSDSLLVMVKAPDQFLTLYLSNRVHPVFPFVKRVLAN